MKKTTNKNKTAAKKGGKAKLATGAPGVGAITIAAGNGVTLVPGTIAVNPDSDLTFLIANQDDVDHQVWINPDLVVNKDSGKKEDPFTGDIGKKNVPAGRSKTITLRIKAKKALSKLPLTLKYTVESFTKNDVPSVLDPDLDVVDPTAAAHN